METFNIPYTTSIGLNLQHLYAMLSGLKLSTKIHRSQPSQPLLIEPGKHKMLYLKSGSALILNTCSLTGNERIFNVLLEVRSRQLVTCPMAF
jgi:hypothetical protein